jgi:hypothetical protein
MERSSSSLQLTLIFEISPTRLIALAESKGEIMSGSNQKDTQRVLARACARILTSDEIASIGAGQNQTFAFTHVITNDTTRD